MWQFVGVIPSPRHLFACNPVVQGAFNAHAHAAAVVLQLLLRR